VEYQLRLRRTSDISVLFIYPEFVGVYYHHKEINDAKSFRKMHVKPQYMIIADVVRSATSYARTITIKTLSS